MLSWVSTSVQITEAFGHLIFAGLFLAFNLPLYNTMMTIISAQHLLLVSNHDANLLKKTKKKNVAKDLDAHLTCLRPNIVIVMP